MISALSGVSCRNIWTMELYREVWTLLLLLLLLLALAVYCAATERCPASGATSFTLTVASRRNLTGLWTISVDTLREDPKQSSLDNSSREVTVEVEHRTGSCQDTDSARMSVTATLAVLSAKASPPPGYETINGLGFYKIHTSPLTWEEARDKCVQEGGHLIVINSDQEAEVVKRLFARDKTKIKNATSNEKLFVGIHDRDTEGEFVTVLGEPLANTGYTRWRSGQPNEGKHANCGVVYGYEVQFLDEVCSWKLAFICEYSTE